MNRVLFDALAAVTLAVTALVGAYAPVMLMARARARGVPGARSLTYVLGNMLSAGVMVSAGFCHLLDDALDSMPVMRFPLAPFLAGVGYFLTLVADSIASSATSKGATALHPHCGSTATLPGGTLPGSRRSKACDADAMSTPTAEAPGPPGFARSTAINGNGRAPPRMLPQSADSIEVLAARSTLEPQLAGTSESESLLASDALVVRVPPAGNRGAASSFEVAGSSAADPEAGAAANAPPASRVAFVTAVLMGVALCFHSVLEGAALGAQETVASSAHIFIAIVSHKGLAAYALGSSVVDSGVETKRFWSVILPFTLASPAGIALGYIVSGLAQGVGAASISALAAGTFLYVAFMEVIPKELRDRDNTARKLVALCTGYGIMSMLAIWA